MHETHHVSLPVSLFDDLLQDVCEGLMSVLHVRRAKMVKR